MRRQFVFAAAASLIGLSAAASAASAPASVVGPGYAAAAESYQAEARGDVALALSKAQAAVRAEPSNRQYRLLLISLLARARQLTEADREASAYETQFGPDAGISAQRGYVALQLGDKPRARDLFASALSLGGLDVDQTRDARLTVADLAAEAGDQAGVLQVLAPVAQERSYAVQSRRAYALAALDQTTDAAEAFRMGAETASTPEQRGAMARGRIYALAKLNRRDEARAEFQTADRAGWLTTGNSADAAELAAGLGDDARAQQLFAAAETKGEMKPSMWFDAGFSAERLGRKRVAARDFERGLEADRAGQITLSPKTRLQVRREVAELSRRWGAYATVFYGENGAAGSTSLLSGQGVSQVGTEVYYRPEWAPGGAQLQVFARAFETLSGPGGTATGWHTIQGWVGAEVKPLRTQNLVFEASRMVKVGALARDDWMLRAAWSTSAGLSPELGRRSWPMWLAYLEAARVVDFRENLGFADLRYGRTFEMGREGRLLAAPFVGAVYAYDNKLARHDSTGVGPGVTLRTWFRETRYKAPQSYVDLTVQYRARVSGDRRGEGLFATLGLSF